MTIIARRSECQSYARFRPHQPGVWYAAPAVVVHCAGVILELSRQEPSSVAVRSPDPHPERLADAQTYADGDAHDKGDDQDPDYYPVAVAHFCEKLA